MIVAIKKHTGKMLFNPAGETVLEGGDILVGMGSPEHLDTLARLARPGTASPGKA